MKGAGASAGAARKSHCANSGSRSARSSAPIPAAGARRVSEHAGLRGRAGRGGADGEEAEEGGAELSKFSAAAPSGGRRPAGPSPPPFPHPPVAKVKDGRGAHEVRAAPLPGETGVQNFLGTCPGSHG